jgi:hypothetical protein
VDPSLNTGCQVCCADGEEQDDRTKGNIIQNVTFPRSALKVVGNADLGLISQYGWPSEVRCLDEFSLTDCSYYPSSVPTFNSCRTMARHLLP